MGASITVAGLSPVLERLTRSRRLQQEMVDVLHRSATPIRAEMGVRAHTRIQNAAMSSVDTRKTGVGIEIAGGKGGGLGSTLFAGGEFGGRRRVRTYATRSPLGRPYTVKRHTTRMFLPHLGHRGYFYWPTVRDWTPRLTKELTRVGTEILGGR